MTDGNLMALVKQGQLSHMRTIYERYAGRLLGYFRHLTNDRSLSEDLSQIVFEKVIRSRHTYSEQASFHAWIFRIARNTLAEHYRATTPLRNVATDLSLENGHYSAPDFENLTEYGDERTEKLYRALNAIKKEHREILILTRFENLSYQEVADIIGISVTGVKARVFRAMKSLKRAYFQKV